ncbi:uncharacterized protein DS421_3g99810 [Arachis hypogaea]|nr:uncharacterized protein DS421_3g99810 [Arachis hypogaea]
MAGEQVGLETLFNTFLAGDSDEEPTLESQAAENQEDPSQNTVEAGAQSQPSHGETVGTGGGSESQPEVEVENLDVMIVDNPRKRKPSSSPEGVLTVMEKNFDAGNFIDSQLLPDMEDFFLGGDLPAQARWMYCTLLRGAAIARKAEFSLAGMHSLEHKLNSSVQANTKYKAEVESLREQLATAKEQLATAEEKVKTSDAAVAWLTEREMTLERQLNAAQGKVKEVEKERDKALASATAAKEEATKLKGKYKETVKQGKNAILMTEEVLKVQVKLLVADFDTSAVGVFKTIKDGKIVDIPKK